MNTKTTFPAIVIIFFVILFISSAESQTLKSISGRDTEMKKKISAGFYNPQSGDDIGPFDIKPEFLLDLMGDRKTYALGITFELELISIRNASWVISFTPLMKKNVSKEYYRFSGVILTGGRKFYFNNSKARGYFTINLGGSIGSTSKAGLSQSNSGIAFVISPTFGFEYKFSDAMKFETEIKSPYLIPGGLYGIGVIYPGINAGIGFLF